jgi:hypothetical protein
MIVGRGFLLHFSRANIIIQADFNFILTIVKLGSIYISKNENKTVPSKDHGNL